MHRTDSPPHKCGGRGRLRRQPYKFQFVDLLREADMHIIPKAAERKPPPLFRQGFYVSSLGQLISRIFSIAMCSTWQVGVEAAL